MEFIGLGPEDEQEEGDLQTEAASATTTAAAASERQPREGPSTMDSSATKSCSEDIIDLADAREEAKQTEAVGANGVEPLASEHQPQATPSAKGPPVEIIDLEEGQVASDEANAEPMQGGLKLQAESMIVNGVEPLASSEHQPQDGPGIVAVGTKASDKIIDPEEGQVACKAGAAQGGLILQAETPDVNGVEALASEHRPQEDGPGAVDGTKVSDEIMDLEEGQVEDMDLSDDDVVVVKRQPSDDAPVQSQTSAPAALHSVSAPIHASSSTFIDETPPRGVKRARVESAEPSVRVVYNNLTRESKRRLMELMQQWSEWQARKQHALTESVEEILECGEETYYPALHVGSERYSVSFCVDYQARENVAVDDGAVPLYNREFTLGSTPLGDSSNIESKQDKDDSRCFNCGSYSHALKDCPKPRDHVAISNARKQHNSKRNLSNANRGQNRYYQKTPGKFDDLKAGVLGSETRECLGLRENDPPPWLHRMRELGYPPGYLDEVEDEDKPSGITIFGGDREEKAEHEEGELPEQGSPPSPPRKKMMVDFPGINAPVPENGDPWLWGSTPPPQSVRHHHHLSSDSRDRGGGPPGAEHYSSSRHHPYDHGVLPTPGLVRSHSDRSGRRSSSSGYYENPPPPPPGEEATWTPHGYSSRQHSSSSERHSRDRERERERDWHDRHYYSSSSRR